MAKWTQHEDGRWFVVWSKCQLHGVHWNVMGRYTECQKLDHNGYTRIGNNNHYTWTRDPAQRDAIVKAIEAAPLERAAELDGEWKSVEVLGKQGLYMARRGDSDKRCGLCGGEWSVTVEGCCDCGITALGLRGLAAWLPAGRLATIESMLTAKDADGEGAPLVTPEVAVKLLHDPDNATHERFARFYEAIAKEVSVELFTLGRGNTWSADPQPAAVISDTECTGVAFDGAGYIVKEITHKEALELYPHSTEKCSWCGGPQEVDTHIACDEYQSALEERLALGAEDTPFERESVRRWVDGRER